MLKRSASALITRGPVSYTRLVVTSDKGEPAVVDKLYNYKKQVLVRNKSKKLTGAVTGSESVVSNRQVDEHITSYNLYLVLDVFTTTN